MADVKCLKDGKFAVPNDPGAPQVSFKEGDVLMDIRPELADRMIELEFAEPLDEVEEDDGDQGGGDGNGTTETAKRKPWQRG